MQADGGVVQLAAITGQGTSQQGGGQGLNGAILHREAGGFWIHDSRRGCGPAKINISLSILKIIIPFSETYNGPGMMLAARIREHGTMMIGWVGSARNG